MHADQQFAAFVEAYPASRRQRGYMAETLFLHALEKVSFDHLLAAVRQHTRSEQWQTPKLIPSMLTWLQEERWIQVLPEVEATPADTQRILKPADAVRARQTGRAQVSDDRAAWTPYARQEGLLRADPPGTPPPNKYHAIPVHVDGVRFASKKEAARYHELCTLAHRRADRRARDAARVPPARLEIGARARRSDHDGRGFTADFRYT